MAGERTLDAPPSRSYVPAEVPASRPVTRSLTPLTVVPSCFAPLEVVAAGSPRSHAPVVAVSVPPALVVQPVAVSNVSWYTVVPVVPVASVQRACAAASPARLSTVSLMLLGNVSQERW